MGSGSAPYPTCAERSGRRGLLTCLPFLLAFFFVFVLVPRSVPGFSTLGICRSASHTRRRLLFRPMATGGCCGSPLYGLSFGKKNYVPRCRWLGLCARALCVGGSCCLQTSVAPGRGAKAAPPPPWRLSGEPTMAAITHQYGLHRRIRRCRRGQRHSRGRHGRRGTWLGGKAPAQRAPRRRLPPQPTPPRP